MEHRGTKLARMSPDKGAEAGLEEETQGPERLHSVKMGKEWKSKLKSVYWGVMELLMRKVSCDNWVVFIFIFSWRFICFPLILASCGHFSLLAPCFALITSGCCCQHVTRPSCNAAGSPLWALPGPCCNSLFLFFVFLCLLGCCFAACCPSLRVPCCLQTLQRSMPMHTVSG